MVRAPTSRLSKTTANSTLHRDFLLNPKRMRRFSLDAFDLVKVGHFANLSFESQLTCMHLKEVAPEQQLIIHSFSNGGAFLVAEHLRSWRQGEATTLDPSRVAGLVFDSAPAYLHAAAGGKAMTASMAPGPLRSAAAAAVTVLSKVWGASAGDRGPEGYWNLMRSFEPLQREQGQLGCPELYIYSRDDAITHFSDLDRLVSHRDNLPRSHVLRTVLDSSPHVSHLKTCPNTYTELCAAFAQYSRGSQTDESVRDSFARFERAVRASSAADGLLCQAIAEESSRSLSLSRA